ncbi:MAG: hypothetical protein SFV51_32285 [Bryobacteraceae bacterium]|nr:hypothetical protein [Bryobacteraceae bacterium]
MKRRWWLLLVLGAASCAKKKPAPRPAAKTAPRLPARKAPAPKPAGVSSAASPAVAPQQLGRMLTPAQAAQHAQAYQQSARAAEKSLATIAGRKVSREQSESAARVRSLLKQAADMSGRDVSMAEQLARRAEVLARDLAGSVAR